MACAPITPGARALHQFVVDDELAYRVQLLAAVLFGPGQRNVARFVELALPLLAPFDTADAAGAPLRHHFGQILRQPGSYLLAILFFFREQIQVHGTSTVAATPEWRPIW